MALLGNEMAPSSRDDGTVGSWWAAILDLCGALVCCGSGSQSAGVALYAIRILL